MAHWTPAQLSLVMSPRAYVQCCDDDGDGTADAAVVADLQVRSDMIANAYLRKYYSWTLEADAPELAYVLSVQVGADMAYRRRPEFVQEGKTPASAGYEEAKKLIDDIGKAKARADDGSAVPTNVTAAFRTGTVDNDSVTTRPRFIADDAGDF
jgi:hypothetical protein